MGGSTMFKRSIQIVIIFLVCTFGAAIAAAQGADGTSSIIPKRNEREQTEGVRDMLEKMRIEKEKKDHEEMLKRGQDALNLSSDLEKAVDSDQKLTGTDLEKLDKLERLVKRIRGELGGGDDDEESVEKQKEERPVDVVHGVKALRSVTLKLVDELKKTTRFTISAAAIRTTNAVLRLTRFLRFSK